MISPSSPDDVRARFKQRIDSKEDADADDPLFEQDYNSNEKQTSANVHHHESFESSSVKSQ